MPDLPNSRYVLLTTFRRSGVAVATAVWIAPDGDRLLVTTGVATGKVKRIRANGRATLQACTRRGEPVPGAPVVEVGAKVATDAATNAATRRALAAKYGWQYWIAERAAGFRRHADQRASVVLTPPA